MAHWLTAVIMLTCLGGLISPKPVTLAPEIHRMIIKELVNITKIDNLCNGTMMWSVNLTGSEKLYCEVLGSMLNVSNCSDLKRTLNLLFRLCPQRPESGVPSNVKIEAIQFARDLLSHFREMYRTSSWTSPQTRVKA